MKTAAKLLSRFGKLFFWLFMLGILGVIGIIAVIAYYSTNLPNLDQLVNYKPKTMTRLYDAKSNLLAEYAEQKRVYVPINSIPPLVKNAFISAEDKSFYTNNGIDPKGILRAAIKNVKTKLTGTGGVSGASTITQQVIKNLLLTNEKSIERKIKEAILAVRVSNNLTKDNVLEIYLNEIFLGKRSYGVGAAALSYFNKPVSELNIQEAALLGAMPKAPSRFSPDRDYDRALERRNWVIGRMLDDEHITEDEAKKAISTKIELIEQEERKLVTNHFAEEVRRKLLDKFGEEKLYGGGLAVRTTLDPELQKIAEDALYNGITSYDRQYGWRGAIAKIEDIDIWRESLSEMEEPKGLGPWEIAVVLESGSKTATIGFLSGKKGKIYYADMKWAKKNLRNQSYGGTPRSVREVLKVGDVVPVSKIGKEEKDQKYALEQIPNVNGAITVMDPSSGRVLAMVGGYTYGDSQFNRATQAKRQPGSAFKPFVYAAALENGFSPATIIEDGPIEIQQTKDEVWMPKNYSGDFLGYVSLRKGLEKSRNNMTILLALMLGIDKIQEIAQRTGIMDKPLPYYSTALGAQETTLMKLTAAYAMIANGGKEVAPKTIDRVQDSQGQTVYREDQRVCVGCVGKISKEQVPVIKDTARQIIDPVVAYQLTSMLEGVVQRGTGVRARKVGKPLAGKTGTTNNNYDTWFMGFSPDLVVGTYIGFDNPKSLGRYATGSSVALPIFVDFMKMALAKVPAKPFKAPNGVIMSKIDVTTGIEPTEYSLPENVMYEIFNPSSNEIEYSEEYMDYKYKLQEASKDIYIDDYTGGVY